MACPELSRDHGAQPRPGDLSLDLPVTEGSSAGKAGFRPDDPPLGRPAVRQAGQPAPLARRVGGRILHELRTAVAPTAFFFVGFNLIVLTTNLLVAEYLVAVSNFMLATAAALVVGKAILVANAIPLLRRFDRAPLIKPILFKTTLYCLIIFVARVLERFVQFSILEGEPPSGFLPFMIATFSWKRFVAIQLWIAVLLLIYVTASEFSSLFGRGEMRRLFFVSRPSALQLDRRQRFRELLRLSRLADAHTADEFRNPASGAHEVLVEIVRRLARRESPDR